MIIVLAGIALVSGLALGGLNEVTRERIQNNILKYKKIIESLGVEPTFYSPGLISQGGEITDAAKAAGKRWHAIVGRAIYQAKDITRAAKDITKKIA